MECSISYTFYERLVNVCPRLTTFRLIESAHSPKARGQFFESAVLRHYSWLQPKLPEDLAFYPLGNTVWLATISHEHQAWFLDESLLPAEIYAYVPDIKIREHTR